jgi:hypothetical protein
VVLGIRTSKPATDTSPGIDTPASDSAEAESHLVVGRNNAVGNPAVHLTRGMHRS